MASVMLLLRHRVKLVEELLEVSVVRAEGVAVDVEVSLAMTDVCRYFSIN